MRDQTLTKREEARLIKAYQRILLEEGFPNAERVGCPGIDILGAMAFRKLGSEQIIDWIEHLGTCTPCFREYTELRKQAEWRWRAAYAGVAAAVIIVILSIGWSKWRIHRQAEQNISKVLTVDLSHWGRLRGEDQPTPQPVRLERARLIVTIRLPIGEEPGEYQVAVQRDGKTLAQAKGEGKLENYITTLHVRLDCTGLNSGAYILAIRQAEGSWEDYPAVVP